jgi:hypothetical protein
MGTYLCYHPTDSVATLGPYYDLRDADRAKILSELRAAYIIRMKDSHMLARAARMQFRTLLSADFLDSSGP